jgi:ParB-like chromosome segregation protein Spo0J
VNTTSLKVAQIEESRKVKVRDQLNKQAVQDYADLYSSSGADALPPLDIFQEKGCKRWVVADGRHRLAAAKKAGLETLPCKVYEGDDLAALKFASACNKRHGVRRTDADVGTIIRSILDSELADDFRTDEAFSDHVGVSTKTVQRHRAAWRDEAGGNRVAKKQDAERAAKHRPKTGHASSGAVKEKSAELDNVQFDKPDKTAEFWKNQASPSEMAKHAVPPKRPLTDEQKKVGAQVRESLSRSTPPPKRALAHDRRYELKRGVGIFSGNDDPELVANDSGVSKESWIRARDFINNVLEHL